MRFGGSYVAIVTPFTSKERVDVKVLERLVGWHIEQGTDGIVCCGTTGEANALSEREKKKVAEVCIHVAARRIPILVGTGVSGTRETVRLTEQMKRLGAEGCLVVTPFYNKPTQRGCVAHFQEVAKVGLPIIVYHNPGRAAFRLSVETVGMLEQIPGVVALKDSGGDLGWVREVHQRFFLPIVAGDDDLTYQILQEGGGGAISVIGNVIPRLWSTMIHSALRGEWNKARNMAHLCLPLCKALFVETNPQGVKFAMKWLGLASEALRLPLVPVLEETKQEIKRSLIKLYLLHFFPRHPLNPSQ